jgi:2-polyprenyl-3-methyl-5-hydroxy-6-metoxy-1,4-benzoquinol methylase
VPTLIAFCAAVSALFCPAVGVGAGMRVVDVACGPGYLAGRATQRGATAIGVDIAEQ